MIVQTQGLAFAYRKKEPILKDISLGIPKGSIFGFLGPNGAGKSTFIRVLLGLLKPQAGTVQVFDMPLHKHLQRIHQRVGSLIEDPSLYKHLTAYENLQITATYRGISSQRIHEVLDIVGLSDAAQKKTRQFSTGMKQRLGLAIALLPDPELVILDEPTNGLDPQGIAEMRELIIRLATEMGKTVFLSSHLLHEIERTCTHVGIIKKGELLFQGRTNELKAHNKELLLKLETSNNEKAATVLKNTTTYEPKPDNGRLLIAITSKEEITGIIDILRQQELAIYQLTTESSNLEDLFLTLTE